MSGARLTNLRTLYTVLVICVVALAAGLGGQARAQDIAAWFEVPTLPAGRVFFDGEILLRLQLQWNQEVELSAPQLHYTIRPLDVPYGSAEAAVGSGSEPVDQGVIPVNQTDPTQGWAELRPELPDQAGVHWYRLEIGMTDGERNIPVANPQLEGGAPVVYFARAVQPGVLASDDDPGNSGDPGESDARRVMAFYYPWYGNPDVTGRWFHWSEGGHDPSRSDARGLPDIGATNHPLLGPYDSHDRRVIEQHLAWAGQAGIDVLIASWWGQGDFTDRALASLLDAAAATPVRIAFYYERVPDDQPEAFIDDILYIVERYGDHPGLFRHNGAPVVFVYARALSQIPRETWQTMLARVRAQTEVQLIADSTDVSWADLFDGLHIYIPVSYVVSGTDMQRIYDALVLGAESRGKISSVTVIPGYDDSNIGRPSPTVAPREGGRLYDTLWEQAINARPQWILITSFNEWHEGSEIEPSFEDGYFYLERTAYWSRRFKEAPQLGVWLATTSIPPVAQPGSELPIAAEFLRKGDAAALEGTWFTPAGWAAAELGARSEPVAAAAGLRRVTFSGRLTVPEDARPGRYPVRFLLQADGGTMEFDAEVQVLGPDETPPFTGAGVWADLGEENAEYGLYLLETPDGRTEPVTIDGIPARRTVGDPLAPKYLYFDVADQFLYGAAGLEIEIGVEYLDTGIGTLRIEYDAEPPAGRYATALSVLLRNSGQWRTASVRLRDAQFMNRQQGGADWRVQVSGDLAVRRVYVRVVD